MAPPVASPAPMIKATRAAGGTGGVEGVSVMAAIVAQPRGVLARLSDVADLIQPACWRCHSWRSKAYCKVFS